jgi:hypothetical protein
MAPIEMFFIRKRLLLVILLLCCKSVFSQKAVNDTCGFSQVNKNVFIKRLNELLISAEVKKFFNNNYNDQIQCFYLDYSRDGGFWNGVLMLISETGTIDSAFNVIFKDQQYKLVPVKRKKKKATFPEITNFSFEDNYFVKVYYVEDGGNELLMIKNKNTLMKGIISVGKSIPADKLFCNNNSMANLMIYLRNINRK